LRRNNSRLYYQSGTEEIGDLLWSDLYRYRRADRFASHAEDAIGFSDRIDLISPELLPLFRTLFNLDVIA